MGYLTVHEASAILKTHANTIYKMCKSGALPAVKLGKEWRIHSTKLADFMERGLLPNSAKTLRESSYPVFHKGHILGLFANEQDIWEFERTFFLSAPKTGHRLVKACWWQDTQEVRSRLTAAGLAVEELEQRGDLVILDLARIAEESGPRAAAEAWYKTIIDALDRGYKGVFGSGSLHFRSCGTHENLMAFERALDQRLRGLPVTGICSYTLPTDYPRDLNTLMGLMESHDRFFIRNGDQDILAQITRVNHHSPWYERLS